MFSQNMYPENVFMQITDYFTHLHHNLATNDLHLFNTRLDMNLWYASICDRYTGWISPWRILIRHRHIRLDLRQAAQWWCEKRAVHSCTQSRTILIHPQTTTCIPCSTLGATHSSHAYTAWRQIGLGEEKQHIHSGSLSCDQARHNSIYWNSNTSEDYQLLITYWFVFLRGACILPSLYRKW